MSGYNGKTQSIRFDEGGFNHNRNIDLIPANAMAHPSTNINLHKGGREKRGGSSHVNSSNQLEGGVRIYGLRQFRLRSGVSSIITATATPKIQDDYATEIQGASWTTADKQVRMDQAEDELYIANGADVPQVWTGAGNTADIKPLKGESGKSFDAVINEALGRVSQLQNDVEQAVNELATGSGDITSAVLAVEKADMTFQLMVEIRNKLISTYEEIMRMQV